jgi:hypothetical protein
MRERSFAALTSVAAAGLCSCANNTSTLVLASTDPMAYRAAIQKEMDAAAKSVGPEHFRKCTSDIEDPAGHGTFSNRYKVAGPYQPNLMLSCLAQGQGSGSIRAPNTQVIAYDVLLQRIGGALVSSGQSAGSCRIVVENGKVKNALGLPNWGYSRRDDQCVLSFSNG